MAKIILRATTLAVFVLFAYIDCAVGVECDPCTCTENTMECRWKNLVDIPSYIPYDTQILRLFRNNIAALKNDSFLTLQKLEELYLTGNRIRTVQPMAFRGLSSLKILELQQNEIEGIPPLVFSFLTRLERLDLSYNFITQLQARVFVHLDSLRELNLRGNRISELGREAFSYMPSVQILQMNENIMQHITSATFQDLANLKEVHLRDNQIETVASDAFSNSSVVKLIDLSGSNKITYMHGNTFRYLQRLETIKLNGNPFLCSCDLYDFRAWMETAVSVNWYEDTLPVCSLPADLKNRNFFSIELTTFVCTTTAPTTTTTTVTTTTEAPTTTTQLLTTTTPEETTTIQQTIKPVGVVTSKLSESTTWFFRPPTSETPTGMDKDFLAIVIGCSCAAFVLIVIIVIVCVCCRKCRNQKQDSGIYKVRENNLAHDHIRPPTNHVRFENEMNDKTESKEPNGKVPNGKLPHVNGGIPNGKLPNGKLPNGNLSSHGNGLTPNGNGHVHNGVLPNHVAKKNMLNEYNNEGYTSDNVDPHFKSDNIFHTDSSLSLKVPSTPTKHPNNNPEYLKNMENLKRDYDHQADISFNPGGSSLDEMDSRPSQRSSSRSSPMLNISGVLPPWDYPPVEGYEPSLCSQSSNSSKKVRTETYV